jgi:hypothetical protein
VVWFKYIVIDTIIIWYVADLQMQKILYTSLFDVLRLEFAIYP